MTMSPNLLKQNATNTAHYTDKIEIDINGIIKVHKKQ